MRIDSNKKRVIIDKAITYLWPEGWEEKIGKELVDYLMSSECNEIYKAKEAAIKHPNFIRATRTEVNIDSYNSFYVGELTLPFAIPDKYSTDTALGTSYNVKLLRFWVPRSGKITCQYGITLPEKLNKVVKKIASELDRKADFHIALSNVLDECTTTEKLFQLCPALEKIISV